MVPPVREAKGRRLIYRIALVAVGSMIGGLLRWGMAGLLAHLLGTTFPWGTLLINILGCLFLGWFLTALARHVLPETRWLGTFEWRLLFAVGFAGAFTTFSTFAVEADVLVRAGQLHQAFAYLFASVFLGLVAVRLGARLAGHREEPVRVKHP